jgi:hypothetical protein
MWTILGLILLIDGALGFALDYLGHLPAPIVSLGIPQVAWVVIALVGAVMLYLNRRPGD